MANGLRLKMHDKGIIIEKVNINSKILFYLFFYFLNLISLSKSGKIYKAKFSY